VPDPVDFFQNTPVNERGRLVPGRGVTKPGDFVTLRAEMDLSMIVTACAWDVPRSPINGDRCTRIRVEIVAG
jgi:uncharacterized protein YcgI (DUF1989 family)